MSAMLITWQQALIITLVVVIVIAIGGLVVWFRS